MTSESFKRGFAALTATFPSMNFNGQLFWETLNDLDGECFLKAVWNLIKNTKELYPGTNVIAIIRERAKEMTIDNRLLLEAETEKERIERWGREAVPMPEECKKELEKLGITLTHH